jgi:hypothetical protein
LYPHCKQRCKTFAYCNKHRCDCLIAITGPQCRIHIIWGRVHSIPYETLSDDDLASLHAQKDKPGSHCCPNTMHMTRCQSHLHGCVQSSKCHRISPFSIISSSQLCIECLPANQCKGQLIAPNGSFVRCARVVDWADPQRHALRLCNSERCNKRIPCARFDICGADYFATRISNAPTLPALCFACDGPFSTCRGCRRFASTTQSILFSKHVYRNPKTKRNLCIYCISSANVVSMLLHWWILRPTVETWICEVASETGFPKLQAQYLVMHWTSFTPVERALFLRDRSGGALAFVMSYYPIHEGVGELMFRTASLPTDIFRLILRMLYV